MPAYNFKKEFADQVESGSKTQTIRKKRKRPTVVGDKIFLYTGMRTKECRPLGEGEVFAVDEFTLFNHMKYRIGNEVCVAVYPENGMRLAQDDGFETWEEFVTFFDSTYGLPFEGEIIHWTPRKKENND